MSFLERNGLYHQLTTLGYGDWAAELERKTQNAVSDRHGKLPEWMAAWNQLPEVPDACMECSGDAVTLTGTISEVEQQKLKETLRQFHPWRKGPFRLFGIPIDTEWRSCLKWNRIAPHLNLKNRTVLDVGCGNGYYGWRMLHAGARLVLGLDPFLLFLMQFEVFRKYAGPDCGHYVLPLTDADLPDRLHLFDVTFSMGVLYHRTSPIDHLQSLGHSLVRGGTLVLETLVIEGDHDAVLVPEDRYAKMRNVWFIPTVPMLLVWLQRCGFRDARVLDVSKTTAEEQRRTEWMTFESLSDYLDPQDSSRTVEGYPAPMRAVLIANKN